MLDTSSSPCSRRGSPLRPSRRPAPGLTKQRVAINMKMLPREFVLTPLQSGALKRDVRRITEVDPSGHRHHYPRRAESHHRQPGDLEAPRKAGNPHDPRVGGVGRSRTRRKQGRVPRCRLLRHLEGRARDRPVRQDRWGRAERAPGARPGLARAPGGLPHASIGRISLFNDEAPPERGFVLAGL
jgi:hypothetical protein